MEVWLQEVDKWFEKTQQSEKTQVLSLLVWNKLVSSVCISLFVSSIDASVSYTCTSSIDRSVQKLCKPQQQRSQAVTEALPFARAHQIDSQSWGILHLQQAAARLIARRFGDSEVTWQSTQERIYIQLCHQSCGKEFVASRPSQIQTASTSRWP